MPRVTTEGQVTIPNEIRKALGIEPGDEVVFEEVGSGYKIQKKEPMTADGEDPFKRHRGSADRSDTMPGRIRRLRGGSPRVVGDENDDNVFRANRDDSG
ncbi:AbrB family transcriptional regulator [Natrialba chahannaoensis JCM 10990]|uniref:AbrB family transcriptional regulator n=1 Tax=Natrialba chahannaoensis JCM 10990 TaxID=1227492 RepID=M0A2L6_9EURY|nr:AbrB/MazE/SpoVT family DNA-binding domain-containing protein [Natrialba chahannaoensis]ELY93000.1 AbrB family transcriptional regulator [Natrialba chahannaoensis JCM 10990]